MAARSPGFPASGYRARVETSEQALHQAQCVIHGELIGEGKPTDPFTKPDRVDGRNLFGHGRRRLTGDGDLWSVRPRLSAARRRHNDQHAHVELVGLDHDCVARPPLLMAHGVLGVPEPVDVTTH